MVFASPIFLFPFLPLVAAAYFALPRRFGNAVPLVASTAFDFWGEGIMLAPVLASVLFNWLLGHRIDIALELRDATALAGAGHRRQSPAARRIQEDDLAPMSKAVAATDSRCAKEVP